MFYKTAVGLDEYKMSSVYLRGLLSYVLLEQNENVSKVGVWKIKQSITKDAL